MVKLAKNQLCETFGVVQFSTFGRKFALDGLLLPRLGGTLSGRVRNRLS